MVQKAATVGVPLLCGLGADRPRDPPRRSLWHDAGGLRAPRPACNLRARGKVAAGLRECIRCIFVYLIDMANDTRLFRPRSGGSGGCGTRSRATPGARIRASAGNPRATRGGGAGPSEPARAGVEPPTAGRAAVSSLDWPNRQRKAARKRRISSRSTASSTRRSNQLRCRARTASRGSVLEVGCGTTVAITSASTILRDGRLARQSAPVARSRSGR